MADFLMAVQYFLPFLLLLMCRSILFHFLIALAWIYPRFLPYVLSVWHLMHGIWTSGATAVNSITHMYP